ncbi:ACT domain-containing protein [Chitinophaga sp. RAB17]|uniref:ACT domain-containing protein n=1 Tax=Chitinophaga sp. RAB17 TaxID=3233049 RepID=UPI003F913569
MTTGITNLNTLLKTMTPVLNAGEYAFCTVTDIAGINPADIICFFREQEAVAIIIPRQLADQLQLPYSFVAAWITLTVHSSLNAVGLTAAFSSALSAQNISCNVVAAYYHDHIFVASKDAEKAMQVLQQLSA